MISITNDDFLAAIFGARKDDAYVIHFPGDMNKGNWDGDKWGAIGPGVRAGLGAENTYYTISLFHDDPGTGKNRRLKGLFEACYVIVIDDVGGLDKHTGIEKMSRDKAEMFLPEPSYILETSPGNFQWGYILKTPETDADRVDKLQGAIIRFLSPDGRDPGMTGVNRVVRMAEGTNGKAMYGTPSPRHALTLWTDARFTLDELALAVNWTNPVARVGGSGVSTYADMTDPRQDTLFAWLDDWDMFEGGRTNDGGYKLECPWKDGHTSYDATPSGAYYPGRGAYKCHHSCGRADGRFRAWCEAKKTLETGQPANAMFPAVTAAQTAMLAAANPATAPRGVVPDLDAFFDETVFVADQNLFTSLRSDAMLKQEALDFMWHSRLEKAGALPAAGKGGALWPPHSVFRDNPRGRKADKMTYWPGQGRFFAEAGVDYVNRWVAPARLGRGTPVTDAEVEPWLKLARHILGCEGANVIEMGLDWFALVVGAPELKPGWHMVLQGGQGIGKDMLIQPVLDGVGLRNQGVVNPVDLGTSFNLWAEKRLVIIDELKQSSRGTLSGHDQYNALKRLTENTSRELKINAKFMKEYFTKNVAAFFITSNDEKAIALEAGDRRFLIIMGGQKVIPWPAQDYEDLVVWLRTNGVLVAEWLHQRWAVMTAAQKSVLMGHSPMTGGKQAMLAATEPEFPAWMRDKVAGSDWPDVMMSSDIQNAINSALKTGDIEHGASPHRWAPILAKLGGVKIYKGASLNGQGKVWAIRNCKAYEGMDQAAIRAKLAGQSAARSDFDDGKVVAITKPQDTAEFDAIFST